MTPKIYRWLPAWSPFDGLALFGMVIARKTASQRLIDHELVHLRQQKEDGWLRYALRYTFSPHWRVVYEAEGYAAQVRGGADIKFCATALSGWRYLWPCSYDVAIEAIRSRV